VKCLQKLITTDEKAKFKRIFAKELTNKLEKHFQNAFSYNKTSQNAINISNVSMTMIEESFMNMSSADYHNIMEESNTINIVPWSINDFSPSRDSRNDAALFMVGYMNFGEFPA